MGDISRDELSRLAREDDDIANSPYQQSYQAEPELKGIGGWLVLFAIGLVIQFLLDCHSIYSEFSSISDPEVLSIFTLFPEYPVFAKWIFLSWTYMAHDLTAILVLSFLFFRKSSDFAILCIALFIVRPCFCAYILGAEMQILEEGETAEYQALLIKSSIQAAIWIPYLLMSKRVRNTFVH